jgi:hypothetical protein
MQVEFVYQRVSALRGWSTCLQLLESPHDQVKIGATWQTGGSDVNHTSQVQLFEVWKTVHNVEFQERGGGQQWIAEVEFNELHMHGSIALSLPRYVDFSHRWKLWQGVQGGETHQFSCKLSFGVLLLLCHSRFAPGCDLDHPVVFASFNTFNLALCGLCSSLMIELRSMALQWFVTIGRFGTVQVPRSGRNIQVSQL